MIYRNYSDLKIFRWLREKIFKIEKPAYIPFSRWETWCRRTKSQRPIAWFVTETIPNAIEKVIAFFIDPLIAAKKRLVLKWVHKPHLVNTRLSPIREHSFKKKLLHGFFEELTYYIEVKLANQWIAWSGHLQKKYHYPMRKRYWWADWSQWRSADAGLDCIRWQLVVTDHSNSFIKSNRMTEVNSIAAEILILYSWWTYIRPKRIDSWELAGFQDFWNELDAKYGPAWSRSNWTAAEEKKHTRLLVEQDQIETERENEDHAMLLRLINLAPKLI